MKKNVFKHPFSSILTLFLVCLMISKTNQAVFGASCKTDKDCAIIYNNHYKCYDKKCRREDLFPLSPKETIGLILLTTISAVANAGGLGGGAVIVPVYIFVFDYVTAESIPMSKATILAGALMNVFLIARKKHPYKKSEFLVDYGLAGAMIPLLLAGTMIGVMLTKLLPPIFVVVLLSAYLFKSTTKMRKKALVLYAKETEENELKERAKNEEGHQDEVGLLSEDSRSSNGDTETVNSSENSPTNRDSSNYQTDKNNLDIQQRDQIEPTTCKSIFMDLSFLVLSFCAILIVALLRGGHGVDSIIGIESCSVHSWGLLLFAQFICYVCSLINKTRHSDKLIGRIGSQKYDENKKRLNHLLLASYISGVGAGLLGIGGGMIMNPVMLDLGFIPEVSAAVAGFSVLFTSSSTTSQFVVAGAINLKQAIYYLFFSCLGSLIGNIIIFRIIKKYNRPSLLVWILFALLFSSVIVLPTMGLYNIIQKGNVFQFNTPC